MEFKFKGDKKIDQYIKILPQKQDQFDTALDPSGAEVYSLLLLLSDSSAGINFYYASILITDMGIRN